MKLNRLSIEGFKSFNSRQELRFDGDPGLYFLTGKNTVDTKLGANGSGKTTVLDALSWAIYDKTSRGVRAGDIENWEREKAPCVELDFELNDTHYSLRRTRKSLLLRKNAGDPEIVKQEEVEALFGMNHSMFHQCIVIPQFASMFFDMTPAQQSEMFSEVLNLEEWDVLSDKAKSRSRDRQDLIHDLTKEINETIGNIEGIKSQDIEGEIRSWETKRRGRLEEIDAQAARLEDDCAKNEAIHKKVVAEIDSLKKAVDDLTNELQEGEKVLAEVKSDIAEQRNLKSQAESKKKDLLTLRLKYERLKGTCVTCDQDIDPAHVKKHINEVDRMVENLQIDLKGIEEELNKYVSELRQLEAEFSVIKNDYAEANSKARDAREKMTASYAALTVAKDRIKSNRSRRLDIENEVNPYISVAAKNAERIEALLKFKDETTAELNGVHAEKQRFDYWIKGFKDIKLFIISEVIQQLEIEVNNNLVKLGMDNWRIVFDVQKENKSGTLKKQFNVVVYSPGNDEPVPWKAWSGGESQRLRIAGTTGLANLMLDCQGLSTNVEFWDEPTNGVNAEGVNDLINVLKDHAKESGKQVWIIDHRSLGQGSFEKVITVVKGQKGSTFQESDDL